MNFKKINSKIIIYCIWFVLLTLIIIMLFVLDNLNTKKNEENKKRERQRIYDEMSENVKKNIPDKGSLLYIHFLDKVNENALFKQKDFRKALFFGLKRTEMAQINENFQPSPILFTKDFYLNNPKYLPKSYFPKIEENNEIVSKIVDTESGYDFKKALKYLKEAFDKLNDEEKKQNYNLKINFDFQENWSTLTDEINNNIKEKFLSQVKNLFETFIQENKLSPNKLTVVNEEKKQNDQLCIESAPQHNDFEDTFQMNIEDYHYFIFEQIILNNINENISLKFDFKEIKEYLNKLKNNKFDTTDVPVIKGKESLFSNEEINKIKDDKKREEVKKLNQYSVSYNALNEQGIFEGKIGEFMDFMKEGISGEKSLFKTYLGSTEYQNIKPELKEIKQKTYQKIFEQMFNLTEEEFSVIPIIIFNK